MAVNWGLQGQGFDPLEALRYAGVQAQTRAIQQRARQETEDRARDQQVRMTVAPSLQSGDYTTARNTALGAGSYDIADYVGKLQEDQRKQFAAQGEAIGSVAASLKGLPVEQRQQAFATALPFLKQQGLSDDDLAGVDFSDAGLNGYIAVATNAKDALSAYAKSREPVTLAQGSRLYRQNGELVAENPAEPRYQSVPEGGMLVRTDGGSATPVFGAPSAGYAPAGGGASGGAVSGRTQYGWTPRARNGGDNDDAAVDGKISGMSRALGISPTAPLDGLSDMQIARALTLSEGGPGSLADRNNNPGNLTDPKTGGYRKFPNKEAGLQAAAAQVRRNRARGQNTIQTMVEGLPVGGRRAAQGSGVPDVIRGNPKQQAAPSGYRYNGDRLEPIPGGPADKPSGGTGSGGGDRKQETALRKEFNGRQEVKNFGVARQQFYTVRDLAKKANPTAQDDIAIIFGFMKTLDPGSTVREGEFATAQNAGGVPDTVLNLYERVQNGQRLNPQQRNRMAQAAYASYNRFREAYNTTADSFGALARRDGIDPKAVAPRAIIDAPKRRTRGLGIGQSSNVGGFKITRTR